MIYLTSITHRTQGSINPSIAWNTFTISDVSVTCTNIVHVYKHCACDEPYSDGWYP